MNEQEILKLRLEIANLKLRKKELEEAKGLKVERMKAKLGTGFAKFRAQHPYLSAVGSGLARGARAVGQNVVNNSNDFAMQSPREPAVLRKPMVNVKRLRKVIPKKKETESAWKSWSEAFA